MGLLRFARGVGRAFVVVVVVVELMIFAIENNEIEHV
jgi:hypothetical protein